MAAIYYDYNTGNDSTGTGSTGNPYKTPQKAVNVANGGDIIYGANTLAAPIASGGLRFDTGFGSSQNANATSRPLVFLPWDRGGSIVTPHPVLGNIPSFRFDASAVTSGQSLWNTASRPTYVYIYGLDIDDLQGSGQTEGSWRFLRCGGDASALASGKALISLGGSGGGSVEECYIRNVPSAAYGILTGVQQDVIGNYIDGVDAGGIGISGSGSVIMNILRDVAGTGIGNGYQAHIRYNTIVGDGATASAIGIEVGADGLGTITDNIIANFAGGGAAGIKAASAYLLARMGNNAFYNNTANISGTITAILEDLTADDIDLTADPFIDAAGENYALRGTSEAIRAAIALWPGSETVKRAHIGAVQSAAGGVSGFFA